MNAILKTEEPEALDAVTLLFEECRPYAVLTRSEERALAAWQCQVLEA